LLKTTLNTKSLARIKTKLTFIRFHLCS